MKHLLTLMLFIFVSAYAVAAESVIYSIDGKEYEGYYTSAGKSAPLVLIVHDWDGLTGYEMKRAEMLKELGYSSFALDMFSKGVRPTEIDERRRLTSELYADRAKMRKLLRAGIDTAKALGANTDNAVIMGYCFGGAVALESARMGEPLKAFISFHGGLAAPAGQDYSKTKGEIVVFHGTADAAISMTEFAGLAEDLEKLSIKHEMTTYSGAPHAFTVFGSPSYREDADKKSWARLTDYLNEVLR